MASTHMPKSDVTSAKVPWHQPRLLLPVVGGIVGRIVLGKNRVGLVVVVEKFGYIAFVVEDAIVKIQLVDRD
ncbi:hypothetical protein Tco_1298878 [Tanacetum coccineum]